MAKSTANNRANQGAKNNSSSAKTTEGCSCEKTSNKAPNAKRTQG